MASAAFAMRSPDVSHLQMASAGKLLCLSFYYIWSLTVRVVSSIAASSRISRSSAARPNVPSMRVWSLPNQRFSELCVRVLPRWVEARMQTVSADNPLFMFVFKVTFIGVRNPRQVQLPDARWTASCWTDDWVLLLRLLLVPAQRQCYSSIPSHFTYRDICTCR